MDNFSVHKFLREQHLNENKGKVYAQELISKLQRVYKKWSDDELEAFRKAMYDHVKDAVAEEKEEVKEEPQHKSNPNYPADIDLTYDETVSYGSGFGKMKVKTIGGKLYVFHKLDQANEYLKKYVYVGEEDVHNYLKGDMYTDQAVIDAVRNIDNSITIDSYPRNVD